MQKNIQIGKYLLKLQLKMVGCFLRYSVVISVINAFVLKISQVIIEQVLGYYCFFGKDIFVETTK